MNNRFFRLVNGTLKVLILRLLSLHLDAVLKAISAGLDLLSGQPSTMLFFFSFCTAVADTIHSLFKTLGEVSDEKMQTA